MTTIRFKGKLWLVVVLAVYILPGVVLLLRCFR
jgi:hypothetical protein